MIAVILTLLLILISKAGLFWARLFPREEPIFSSLNSTLSIRGLNLVRLLSDISNFSDEMFGRNVRAFFTVNLCLYIFYLIALCIYELRIAGFRLLYNFFSTGLTLDLDDRERSYILQHWPTVSINQLTDGLHRLYVGDTLLNTVALSAILLVALSATSSIGILANLRLIRWIATSRPRYPILAVKMGAAFLFNFFCDIFFVILVVLTALLAGKMFGLTIEESFKAQIANKSLTYGFALEIGDKTRSTILLSAGLGIKEVDFDELERDAPTRTLINWALPYDFELDTGSLCDRYGIRPTCRDRLRSLFFRRFEAAPPNYFQTLSLPIIRASQAACGRDLWSNLPGIGQGGAEAVKLALPFIAALGLLFLCKALVIPVLFAIAFINSGIIGIARVAARSSEENLSRMWLSATALFAAPPVLAFLVMSSLIPWIVCS